MTQKIVINPNGDSLYLNNDEMSRYIELSQRPIQTHDDGLGEGSEYTYRHYTLNDEPFGDYNIERTDPALIQLVEESLGNDGELEKLRVVEIPDDVEWEILSIGDTDGCSESIHEKHRVWS